MYKNWKSPITIVFMSFNIFFSKTIVNDFLNYILGSIQDVSATGLMITPTNKGRALVLKIDCFPLLSRIVLACSLPIIEARTSCVSDLEI